MKDMDQFALQKFHLVYRSTAISLLQRPDHYTGNDNFVQFNLWWLRHHIRVAMELTGPSMDDKQQRVYPPGDGVPTSHFDN